MSNQKKGIWHSEGKRLNKQQKLFVTIELCLITAIVGVVTFSALTASATRLDNARPCGEDQYYYGNCVEEEVSDLVGQLRITPDREVSTSAETLVKLSFRVKNMGHGKAEQVRLLLPIDPTLVIGYGEFDNPKVWISSLTDTEVTVSLPALEKEQEVTGNVIFRPKSDPAPGVGTRVTLRFTLKYDDAAGQVARKSNAVTFTFGNANRDVSEGLVMLLVPDVAQVQKGEKISLTGDFFIPNERVNVWYTTSEGISLSLGQGLAGTEGSYKFELDTAQLAPGSYQVVLYGNRSMISGATNLIVIP
jgi:hypothetical protein